MQVVKNGEFAVYLEVVGKSGDYTTFKYGSADIRLREGEFKKTDIDRVYIIKKDEAIFKSVERYFKRFVRKNLNGEQGELTPENAVLVSPEFRQEIIRRHENVKDF